jgi:hypothetical protein
VTSQTPPIQFGLQLVSTTLCLAQCRPQIGNVSRRLAIFDRRALVG